MSVKLFSSERDAPNGATLRWVGKIPPSVARERG